MSDVESNHKELFESERRFRLLVEGILDYAVYMLDPDGIITNWNAGAQRIKGYTAADIVGKHFGIFYPPEERESGLPARSLETARKAGKFETQGWRVRKDGSRFFASVVIDPIYENGALIGFAKITHDITEREAARRALADSERQFRLLVSSVHDYALYRLDPDGIVASWNAGGERIKGYAPEEIIGQHFSRFYTEADRTAGRPARALRLARDTGRYEEEGLRVRKDGSFFWASVVIDPIRDDDGQLVGFAKITRDISERRAAQAELERVQKQLAESQKMDALGQLTGGVAHDFNNILMIVSGHILTLKKLATGNAKAMRAAEAVETATQRASALTRQLLSFARRQRVNPQSIDVGLRIESIREVLVSALGSNIHLVSEIPLNRYFVEVDANEFEIAMVNLVLNARDAMLDGGHVVIHAENVRTHVDVNGPDARYVAIHVRDSGVGIPDDVMPKIFDPFFTTKAVGKGTGLGLSQVHGFAHQAGGTVRVASRLGHGTTFTLYLPHASMPQTAAEVLAAEPKSGVALLVEDNPDVASASTVLLEQLGYRVRWASSAEAALEQVRRNGIDIVLSDIVMPGRMDGLELARTLKQDHPRLPVLLMTGYSDRAQNDQNFIILRKPYEVQELSRAIAQVVAHCPTAA